MPPKSARSKAREMQQKGGNNDRDMTVRKRAQNRISQQCHREKNSTYLRSLERTVELLQSAVASKETSTNNDPGAINGDPETSSDNQYAVFVEAHLEQTRENQQLREAVLRLRKKLLSLSNAALAAADDEIFNKILGEKQHTESVTEKGPRSPPEDHTEDVPLKSQTTGQNEIQLDNGNATGTSDPSPHMFEPMPPEDATFSFEWQVDRSEVELAFGLEMVPEPQDRDCDPLDQDLEMNGHAVTSNMIEDTMFSHNIYDESYQVQSVLQSEPIHNEGQLDFDLGTMMPPFSQAPLSLYNDPIIITSTVVLGTRIVSACQQCILRATGSCSVTRDLPQSFRQDLVTAATMFLTHCLGLEQYIYGINGAQYIEKVLGWRLGLASRDIVPPPFRPTPLQSHDRSHYIGIDLFSWPDVRDQLMLAEQQCLDWESLTKDLLLHLVFEPPRGVAAVSVLDVFLNHILPSQRLASFGRHGPATQPSEEDARNFLNDPSWVLFTGSIPENGTGRMATTCEDPVVQAFVVELEKRMRVLEASPSTSPISISLGTTTTTTRSPLKPNDVATFLGLDNVVEWKLSKEFAEKYPFLDCSAVVSKCDVAPPSTVFCW